MEARLRTHVTGMPKIINSNLVQVRLIFVLQFAEFYLGNTSDEARLYEQTYPDRVFCAREKVKPCQVKSYNNNDIDNFFFSKLIMAKFWYNTVLPIFGKTNVQLLYSGKNCVCRNKYLMISLLS